ncbi:MAG: hypothetical protein K0S68_845 [Candidatus Saccharibacteria bacterium]|nr:hypothetical protein [Candidatus Saccharibacteria bacterium]
MANFGEVNQQLDLGIEQSSFAQGDIRIAAEQADSAGAEINGALRRVDDVARQEAEFSSQVVGDVAATLDALADEIEEAAGQAFQLVDTRSSDGGHAAASVVAALDSARSQTGVASEVANGLAGAAFRAAEAADEAIGLYGEAVRGSANQDPVPDATRDREAISRIISDPVGALAVSLGLSTRSLERAIELAREEAEFHTNQHDDARALWARARQLVVDIRRLAGLAHTREQSTDESLGGLIGVASTLLETSYANAIVINQTANDIAGGIDRTIRTAEDRKL